MSRDPVLSFGLTGISDWSTQMAFLDLMKMSRPWIGHEPGKWGGMKTAELRAGGYLDADGWPIAHSAGIGRNRDDLGLGGQQVGPCGGGVAGGGLCPDL